MKAFYVILLLFLSNKVCANVTFLDTVDLDVYLVKYIPTQELSNKHSVFDERKKISIIPVKALDASLIPRFFYEPQVSSFNGLFLNSTDDVIVWGHLLSEATGKKIGYYYDLVERSGIPTSFSDYRKMPSAQGKQFSYATHMLNISFIKIVLDESIMSEKIVEKYKKAVPNADGTYYIYIPFKVNSQTH